MVISLKDKPDAGLNMVISPKDVLDASLNMVIPPKDVPVLDAGLNMQFYLRMYLT